LGNSIWPFDIWGPFQGNKAHPQRGIIRTLRSVGEAPGWARSRK
jgi:hypothetical protein